jgi:hypothetical protein
MPSLWYRFGFPSSAPQITFIALDSNVFHENGKPEKNDYNFTLTPEQQAEQLVWLRSELEKPLTTPFLVVMAHHPIFSNGPHGDHKVLARDWDPLLRKHNVHLYWPATITISSTWSSKVTPPLSFSPEVAVRTSTRCKKRKLIGDRGPRRYTDSAILRSRRIYSRSAMSMRMDAFYILLRRP